MIQRAVLLAGAAILSFAPASRAFTSPASLRLRPAPGLVSARIGLGAHAARPALRLARVAAGARMEASAAGGTETFEFQAEVSRVMDIIINSLYSDKDVFLRELVSNAADACDKKRFLAVSEGKGAGDELEVKIRCDNEGKKLIIEDSGVGLTKEEMIQNLGRIAQSGTKQFAEMLKTKEKAAGDGEDATNLIGQFGVGFYSGFLVADRMTVISKGLNDPAAGTHRWESEAGSGYTINKVEGEEEIQGESGTRLILHLREDAEGYAQDFKIKQLVQRYSEFVNFPIKVWTTKTTYEQVPDEDAKDEELEEGKTPKMKTVPKTTEEYEVQNSQKPLWMRPPSKVTAEQYEEFYKSTFKAFDKPLTLSHFSLEGQVEFRALLYVPGQLPFELGADMFDEKSGNMRLYVKRVFINDKFQELCPRWLKFVKGVVDSEDLPLNVGREILQKSSVLRVVSRRIVKKSLDMFKDLKGKGGEDWLTFQTNFGKYLKVGIIEDQENREEIGEYVAFRSSAGEDLTTLDGYVERMKEGQKCIYFVSGDSRSQCEMSPAMDKVKENGYEVLYCTEPLDELTLLELKTFGEKEIADLSKDNVQGIDDAEDKKEKKEEMQKDFTKVLEFLQKTLGAKVSKAEVSISLSDSPAMLAQGEYGMSPQMQKYMKARATAMGDASADVAGPIGQASVLQINAEHPIVKSLKAEIEAAGEDAEPSDKAQPPPPSSY